MQAVSPVRNVQEARQLQALDIRFVLRQQPALETVNGQDLRFSFLVGAPWTFRVQPEGEAFFPRQAEADEAEGVKPASLYPCLQVSFFQGRIMDFIRRTASSSLCKPYGIRPASPYVQPILLQQYTASMVRLLQSGEPISAQLVEHKAEELLLLLCHCFGWSFFKPFLFSMNEEHKALRQMVDESLMDNLSVEELAFRNNKSLSSFKRHFEWVFGTTPGKYIRQRKLELACQELMKGKASKEFYMSYGYESASNFIQAFKRAYGRTPKDFQASFRKFHQPVEASS